MLFPAAMSAWGPRGGGCNTIPGEVIDNEEHDEGDCFERARRAS